jgi:hypothetical protein
VNLLLLIEFAAGSIAVLLIVQTLLLLMLGEPLVGPLRLRKAPPAVRWPMKLVLQGVLMGMLFGYPMALGENPLRYHEARLLPARPERLLEVLLVMSSVFLFGIVGEIAAGWVRVKRRYGLWKTLRKVGQSFLTPLPLAFVEEGIFRGLVLDQTLRALPPGRAGAALAIAISAGVFSGVHFIRRARTYWPALGLFVFGCLAGGAYLVGGRTYWLPVGLHAGGILATQLHRPFVEYHGPMWIIGTRDYPISGAIGIAAMLLLGAYVAARFGAVVAP